MLSSSKQILLAFCRRVSLGSSENIRGFRVSYFFSSARFSSFLFGVAAADDFVNAKELRCIQRISGYLGISEKDFKQLKHNALAGNNPYYALGIEENATMEEVKVAYRKMVLKFHPDKREDNVSEEDASLKFREIKRAFELIKKQQKN